MQQINAAKAAFLPQAERQELVARIEAARTSFLQGKKEDPMIPS